MRKFLLIFMTVVATLASAQTALTLDGFAEMTGRKPCNSGTLEPNIYAIGALTLYINKEWSATVEAECDQGEVGITQLFVTKEFAETAKLSAGQITVPIGHTVPYNRPENHLTVFLPESEGDMMPYHWDQLGISLSGSLKRWDYTAMMLLDKGGVAGALRIDNRQAKGLRIGMSGYYGETYLYQFGNEALQYDALGNLMVVGTDYDYDGKGVVSHGYITYSHTRGGFSHNAVCVGTEVGYNVLGGRSHCHRLTPFLRYDYYNTAISETDLAIEKRKTHRLSLGIAYQPINQVFVKAEYAHYKRQGLGKESTLMLGVAVSGALDFLSSVR